MPPSPIFPSTATRAVAVLLALGAAACAQSAGMQTVVDSWRSAPIEEAKAQWGPPATTEAVPNGTAYVWTHEVLLAQAPGSGPREARAPTDPAPPTTSQCQRRLIAGPDGTIVGGDWRGSGCCLSASFGSCARLRYPGPTR